MTMPAPIFFNQLVISMNLYQHAKSQFFSSFYFRDLFDLKVLQSDWPRVFWAISQEPELFQIWDLSKHAVININCHYRPNWEKINKVFLNIQRTLGLSYFLHFTGKILFLKHLAVMHNTTRTPTSCWVPEKN